VIATVHGVYLALLALTLLWNAFACSAGLPEGSLRPWERWLVPGLAALAGLALVDRLRPLHAPLLEQPLVGAAFVLSLLLGVAQNVSAMSARGARLTDIPVLLYNVGIFACVATAVAELRGLEPAPLLLYDYSVLQHLAGSHLAHFSTLSWHLPVFVRRGEARSVPAAMAGLLAPAFCGFAVLVLVLFRSESEGVLASFEREPTTAPARDDLALGVLQVPDGQSAPPGTWAAWIVPADLERAEPPPPGRPLALELCAPESWSLSAPGREAATRLFLDGAERLAAQLQPALLLPFPEPDGVAPLLFGAGMTPEEWRALYAEARRRVRAVSPRTLIAARLSGIGDESFLVAGALAADPAAVDVLGPRLHPGSARSGGPALADEVLAAWDRWRAGQPRPPALWVLAAGISALAYGEDAQLRFVEGCLARAQQRPAIEGLLVESWRDRGRTLGLLRPDGAARPAALALQRAGAGRDRIAGER